MHATISNRFTSDEQFDVDIPSRRIRVRADLVAPSYEGYCLLAVAHRWHRHIERDSEPEPTLAVRKEIHRRVNNEFTNVGTPVAGEGHDRTGKAGCITDSK